MWFKVPILLKTITGKIKTFCHNNLLIKFDQTTLHFIESKKWLMYVPTKVPKITSKHVTPSSYPINLTNHTNKTECISPKNIFAGSAVWPGIAAKLLSVAFHASFTVSFVPVLGSLSLVFSSSAGSDLWLAGLLLSRIA